MTSWHCAPLATITAQDKRRVGPIIRKWMQSLYAVQDLAYWERAFAKIEDISAKTRPSRPVQVYRGARSASEIGNPTHYARWTSWSFDPHHGFQFTPPGEERAPNVMAFVHPEDIEIVLPAFGPGMYREGLCEVILKPGFYIVEKQPYMPSRPPPLSPKNHGYDEGDPRHVGESTAIDVWYHGSPQRFERFQPRIGHTFGTSASEVPIFLTRDPKFAALYAGPKGYVYEVRPHVERTFDARYFVLSDRYWPPEREALTPEGQKLHDDLVENRIFPELIRYGTRHEDEDEWATMHDSHGTYASIMGRDYDVMETTEMKRWLRARGYDSFLVAGDGPDDNLAVFDPERVEILGVRGV